VIARTAQSRKTVLVVEDDEMGRKAISRALAEGGYQARGAVGAVDALAQLEKFPLPDVILLDLKMPGMSGWEFRVEQRRRSRIAHVPVIAISADISAHAAAIDAAAYLSKPFESRHLLDTIERVLLAAERDRLRVQLTESERLRALGVLAAGIAHEINNPLTIVLASTELSIRVLRRFSSGGAA
jgi:two-component system NtrC family sensor kinase